MYSPFRDFNHRELFFAEIFPSSSAVQFPNFHIAVLILFAPMCGVRPVLFFSSLRYGNRYSHGSTTPRVLVSFSPDAGGEDLFRALSAIQGNGFQTLKEAAARKCRLTSPPGPKGAGRQHHPRLRKLAGMVFHAAVSARSGRSRQGPFAPGFFSSLPATQHRSCRGPGKNLLKCKGGDRALPIHVSRDA